MASWSAVVLAAGSGTRMKSRTPKVLHPLCGRPLVQYVVDALLGVGLPRPVLVVPPESQGIREALDGGVEYAIQAAPRGTGDALLSARPLVEGHAQQLLCINGDVPLLESETLRRLMDHHQASGAEITFLTAMEVPQDGLGRVERNGSGQVLAVVEEHEASEAQGRIHEVNAGVYCFQSEALWPRLTELGPGQHGEWLLTDLVALAIQAGGRVETVQASEGWEVLGINTRVHLAQAEGLMRERIRHRCMLQGVTLIDPASTYIDSTVEVGQDTVIFPNTHLYGDTRIGSGSRLGPNTMVVDSTVGEGCQVVGSVLEGATLEPQADVGPFSHLRSGAYVESGVHIGNFVEVKESRLGQGTRVGHFSYIGNATLGPDVNIGAGTVTCNFDGVNKNPTVIGEGAFIGCDTMLVAPVKVGPRAVTGAGSVVTQDVDADAVVMGVPAKPQPRKRARKKERQ